MSNTQEIIYKWERQAGFYSPPIPKLANLDIMKFRLNLIKEEVAELEDALYQGDIVEAADALADIIWVVYGTAHAFGMDLDDLIEEVGRSNNTKLIGSALRKKRGLKVQKGPAYEPPKIEQKLIEQTRRGQEED